MRYMRAGLGSAAAIALLAGTAVAQQNQEPGKQHGQKYGQQQMGQQQFGQQRGQQLGQMGQQPTQYRDTGEWRQAQFIPELSDAIVILKSEEDDVSVHIINGQVMAKLDGDQVPSQLVEHRGDRLRVLDQEGDMLTQFTLPDLQVIQQAQLMQRQQFMQPGVQDRQFGIQERQFGVQDPWQQDDRGFRDQQRFQQDDWRFRDQQRFQQDDWRFRDQQRFEDQRFQRDGQMQFRDQRHRDPHIGDTRYDFGRTPGQFETGRTGVDRQLGINVSRATERDLRATPYRQGLVIENVQRGSPLDNYGVRSGDVIVGINDRPATQAQLQRTIQQMDHRDTMQLTLVRDGREGVINLRGREIAGLDRADRDGRILGAPGLRDDRFRDDRFDRRQEIPSNQERLFRLPGQVPPGPDAGIYQPRYDQPRWDRTRDGVWDDRTWGTEDRWDTRDTWDDGARRNGWDRRGRDW